jgi:pilus assembly protein Flp/PilA
MVCGAENADETRRQFDLRIKYGAIMKNIFARFLKDESGATAIEYALIAAGIALAIITAVNGVGTALTTKFNSISTSLK